MSIPEIPATADRTLSVLLLAVAACAHRAAPVDADRASLADLKDRAGLVLADDPWGDGATKLLYLDQGWGVPETLWFYYADQGSTLLPYEVIVHLEQADNQARVMDPANVVRYRMLPQLATPNNPDALPVGWSRHGDSAGLTCAACHTGQITYDNTAIRIDGAPTTADLMGFFEEIRTGLIATLGDSAKLERFVVAARGQGGRAPTDADRAEVRAMLTDTLAWFEDYKVANHTDTLEGFGRLDAVGRIHNQVARFTSDPSNSKPPNAPASFPLLWDAPRHDYVQWAAFAPNAGPGSLGRNAGEVLGVFGQVEVQHYEDEESAKKGYRSTIEGNALVSMEESLYRLQSPAWPESVLPAIDRAKAERGAALYQTNCVSCHALIDRDDPQRKVTAMVTGVDVVGTDPLMVENLVGAMFPAGKLEGAITPDGTRRYGAMESGPTLSQDLVIRSLATQPSAAIRALAYAEVNGLKDTPKQGNHTRPTTEDPAADRRAYKARPLNGAWASSPYLHNGSVPTLYDLLLPPEQRPARFAVGRWAYDPVKVGYVSDGDEPFVLDTSIPGNRNVGHLYGTTLSDEERWALVEYLETL